MYRIQIQTVYFGIRLETVHLKSEAKSYSNYDEDRFGDRNHAMVTFLRLRRAINAIRNKFNFREY